jgi:hypothetical protein
LGEAGGGSPKQERERGREGEWGEGAVLAMGAGFQQNGQALDPGWPVHVGCWRLRGHECTVGEQEQKIQYLAVTFFGWSTHLETTQ